MIPRYPTGAMGPVWNQGRQGVNDKGGWTRIRASGHLQLQGRGSRPLPRKRSRGKSREVAARLIHEEFRGGVIRRKDVRHRR